ncbi:MAG: hypothetical protein ACI9BN_001529, partial [Francisella sp.]
AVNEPTIIFDLLSDKSNHCIKMKIIVVDIIA